MLPTGRALQAGMLIFSAAAGMRTANAQVGNIVGAGGFAPDFGEFEGLSGSQPYRQGVRTGESPSTGLLRW